MPYNPANTLIVFALESETQTHWADRAVLHVGVGKVNAAYRLTKALEQWRQQHGQAPELVLNLGSAGSKEFNAGTLVNCTRFVQRDFDVTPLGHDAYHTPYDGLPTVLATGLRFAPHDEGICGTGDNFVTDAAMHAWNVVDMEAYALAKVCLFEQIPFGCLKFITDGADGHAATTWEASLNEAALRLHEACAVIISA